jgi:ComF family protein
LERLSREFDRKFLSDSIINEFRSCFIFFENSVIQKIIHHLKYDQNFHAAKYLGKLIFETFSEIIDGWEADIIIPVPLHKLRQAERGYNQAEEIARELSNKTGISVKSKLLRRTKHTSSQTSLNLIDRKNNIADAFDLKNKKMISGKRIILIDDVITTGATISECGSLLKSNGADKLFALSAAIAD